MIFLTIWPLFALICLGFALKRVQVPEPGFWPAAERINYVLLFPALLISSLAEAPLNDPAILRLGGASVVTICIAAMALYLVRRRTRWPAARFGPLLQGLTRFNTYLGLATTASLLGGDGLQRAAVVLAIAVPLVNVLSVFALTEPDARRGLRSLLRPVYTNPLILACVAGIAIALTGIGLPFGIGRFLQLLAQASLPLGLLCVGAALLPASLRQEAKPLIAISGLRLLAMPVLAALVGLAFGLEAGDLMVLVIFSAIPTAPTSYVLTRQLNGDSRLMAGIVTAQTMAAIVTIPIVLAVA